MRRDFYLNPNAGVGDTFGTFADRTWALKRLRDFNRDERTHTIVKTGAGWVVHVRGY